MTFIIRNSTSESLGTVTLLHAQNVTTQVTISNPGDTTVSVPSPVMGATVNGQTSMKPMQTSISLPSGRRGIMTWPTNGGLIEVLDIQEGS